VIAGKVVRSIVLLACGLTSFRVSGQIPQSGLDAKYDKFHDWTIIRSTLAKVENSIRPDRDDTPLTLHLAYVCKGDTSHCRPVQVEAILMVQTINWRYKDYRTLVLLWTTPRVNGPAKPNRIMAEPNWNPYVNPGGSFNDESMTADIPLIDFLQLAKAEEVEGELGNTTFKLSKENLEALRAVAAEIEASGKGK